MALATLSLAVVNNAADRYDGLPTVTTDKGVYLAGQTLSINVTCYLPSSFSSTGQCYFTVEDALGNTIYDLRNHVGVFWVLTTLVPPKTFSFNWDQKDDAGQQVKSGNYEIWGYEAGFQFWGPPLVGNSTSVLIVQTYNVSLVPGWNMVSLPLVGFGYRASTLGLLTGDIVTGWNGSAYNQIYVVGRSPARNDFAILENTGYWIFVNVAETLAINGVVPTGPQSRSITVPPGGGWVLIGLNSLKTWHASDIPPMFSPPGSVNMVARYDPVTGMYRTYIGTVRTDFLLFPGQAFFVWCNQNCTMTYNP
jgi:hypothetical protein